MSSSTRKPRNNKKVEKNKEGPRDKSRTCQPLQPYPLNQYGYDLTGKAHERNTEEEAEFVALDFRKNPQAPSSKEELDELDDLIANTAVKELSRNKENSGSINRAISAAQLERCKEGGPTIFSIVEEFLVNEHPQIRIQGKIDTEESFKGLPRSYILALTNLQDKISELQSKLKLQRFSHEQYALEAEMKINVLLKKYEGLQLLSNQKDAQIRSLKHELNSAILLISQYNPTQNEPEPLQQEERRTRTQSIGNSIQTVGNPLFYAGIPAQSISNPSQRATKTAIDFPTGLKIGRGNPHRTEMNQGVRDQFLKVETNRQIRSEHAHSPRSVSGSNSISGKAMEEAARLRQIMHAEQQLMSLRYQKECLLRQSSSSQIDQALCDLSTFISIKESHLNLLKGR